MKAEKQEVVYHNEVLTRFELYNSLFLTLPFYRVKHTGNLLPFFTQFCEEKVAEKLDPKSIIEDFFTQNAQYIESGEQIDLLFRLIQYIERQVVLFDAVEDAAFVKTGRSDDAFLLESLIKQAKGNKELTQKIEEKLRNFSLRLVLTAHPTQFYPGPVLGIMTDLIEALKKNEIDGLVVLLQQLGKTPFINKTKPTPVDEAASLVWFLENVFYQVVSEIEAKLDNNFDIPKLTNLVQLGFWPGGDRDGNPNVTMEGTKKVFSLLRTVLFRCYYRDFRVLKRRITFRGVESYMENLQNIFYENSFNPLPQPVNVKAEVIENLEAIGNVINEHHNGLFIDLVEDLLRKVRVFGCFFASLDIRQDSSVLRKTYLALYEHLNPGKEVDFNLLTEEDKIAAMNFSAHDVHLDHVEDPLVQDTLDIIRYVKNMQASGGEQAAHRFIISNCQQASDILELMQLFLWSGWKAEDLKMDFVPLFETVDDLQRAANIMKMLYQHPFYREYLQKRNSKQTIMLGFSDSTKDGGYLMANWSIYKAKIELTYMAREHGIDLTFFDGRGGPPARGGGKTQRFYASMGKEIANDNIQLTIQGQSISSQFGSFDTAHYNLEQLLQAGLTSTLYPKEGDTLSKENKELINAMAEKSHEKYLALRQHPLFLEYLECFSPLPFLSQINISSRPVKRNSNAKLQLTDLRMISFVTAWSQLKQGIPGFFGVGTALESIEKEGLWDQAVALYQSSGMFQTIIDNCSMAMSKTNFDFTAYLAEDEKFGEFWNIMNDEFERTKKYVLKISNTQELMDNYPVDRDSIAMREKIVLPLIVIQHFALQKLNEMSTDDERYEIFSKLVTRTVYGVVNAGRNLA